MLPYAIGYATALPIPPFSLPVFALLIASIQYYEVIEFYHS